MVVSQHVTPGGVAEPLQVAVQADVSDVVTAGEEPRQAAVSAVAGQGEADEVRVRPPLLRQHAVCLLVQEGGALVVPVVEGERGEVGTPPGDDVVTVHDGPVK